MNGRSDGLISKSGAGLSGGNMAKRSKRFYLKNLSYNVGSIHLKLDMSRFERQFQQAQYYLDGAVMNSMVPYMPMVTGSFINTTRAASAAVQGSGFVYAGYGPQGRYLYEGKVMVDELTGLPLARRGARKVLVSEYTGKTNARENITYTHQAHPKAQDHWFEVAKQADGKTWIKGVKRIAGGGKHG